LREIGRKIEKFSDRKKRLEATLQRSDPDVLRALKWIRKNSNMFEKPILGPLVMEVNVTNDLHAKYLEMNISRNNLMSFVAQTPGDRQTFKKELIDREKVKVTIYYIQPNSREYDHPYPYEDIRQFGFTHYLDDVFEAEEIVKKVLRGYHSLHAIPIGGEEIESNLDLIDKHLPRLSRFISAHYQHSFTISSYGGGKVEQNTRINNQPPQFFGGENLEEKNRLENEYNDLNGRIKVIEKEMQNLSDSNLNIELDKLNVEFRSFQDEIKKKKNP